MKEEKEPKKIPLIPIAIIVLILVLGYLFLSAPSQEEKFVELNDGTEVSTQFYDDEFQNLPAVDPDTFIPKTDLTLNECKEMDSVILKEDCVKSVAITNQNPLTCEEIASQEIKDLCYIDLAFYYEMPELCLKSMEGKSDCMLSLAVKTRDSKYCENTEIERQTCFEAVRENNESKCYEITDGRWECRMAVQARDSVKCNEIESKKEPCYYYLATATLNENLCSKTGDVQDGCFFRIALDKKNPEICKKYPEATLQWTGNCIGYIAFENNNINLCYQIEDAIEKQKCIEDIQYEYESGN
ncbi:MAG: hypothetical protein ABIA76_05950 [Candidatus Diapherotrites archaeon]